MAISKIKSDSIDTIAATKLTGTVDNARITLDAAEVPDLDAAKITTGDIAVARLGNAPATDLTPLRQDIATLALYNAVSDNRSAYNLPSSFIDQFEDDTGVTTQTDVDNVSEYFASVYIGGQTLISGGTGTIIGSQTSAGLWDGSNTTGQTSGGSGDNTAGKDWGVGNTRTVTGYAVWNNENTFGIGVHDTTVNVKLQGSTDNFSSSIVALGETGLVADGLGQPYPFKIEKLTGITTTTAYRYHRILINVGTDIRWSEIELYDNPSVANTTGTLISDTQTATGTVTKMSGVILYKDNGSGASTLGSHLQIWFSANGGTNWTQATSYGAVTPLFSTGVNMVRLGETTLSHSGTAPVMKAVWASQASGTLETQLHGWAMNY